MNWWKSACLLTATTAVAAACGTTTPLMAQTSAGDLSGAPGSTTTSNTSAPGGTLTVGPSGKLAPGVIRASGVGKQAASSATGTSATAPIATAGAIPVKGPGWDATHVYVGIVTASDASAGLQALGISLSPGDEIGDARAVVDDLNRRGGLFGRRVVLVDKDDKSADVLANPASAGQADCVFFTQDHPAIGVINTDASLDLDSFRRCFAAAHTPLVSLTTAPFDEQTTAGLAPYFYNALTVSWSRLTPVLVRRLAAESYFTGWNATTGGPAPTGRPKIGVLYGSDSAGTRCGPALIRAIQRAGYAAEGFQYSQDSDASAAVLKFAGDGITHVIGIDSFQFFFMTSARSQHYLPRYGVTSYNAPQALLQSNGDPTQLAGAVGVGWYPTIDTDDAHDPGPGPGTRGCLAALNASGQTFSGHRFAAAVGYAICDGIHLAVLGAKAGGDLDPASIRTGIVRLGAQFPTAGGFGSGLSATNFAMPGVGRDLAWNPSCTCFAYLGSSYLI